MKKYQQQNVTIHHTDCLNLLKTLADNSIDLIATDPPYFKVKGESWDNQWKNERDFFTWLDKVLVEFARVLKPIGSLYLFAGPHLATKVERAIAERFNVLNHIIWRKQSGRHLGCNKESLRRFFPQTEHIIFAESVKKRPFAYEPIRAYLEQARLDAGVSRAAIDKACGCQMSGHWFGRSQWAFPSKRHYKTINGLLAGALKPYAQLKAEYVALRDGDNRARRVFNVTKQVPFTNVWDFDVVNWYEGKHPCEKPLDLMTHIVNTSSLTGDVVFDAFTGSGSTALACRAGGRTFIGCEMGEAEFALAVERLG